MYTIVKIDGRICDKWEYTAVEVKTSRVERFVYLLELFGFTCTWTESE